MQHEQKPFYKIIHVDSLAGHAEVIGFDDVDELLFHQLRQGKVKRDADSIAQVSRLLLANSKNIQIIDPYFSAKNKGFVKSIKAMLNVVGQNVASIQFHTSYMLGKTEVCIAEEKVALDKYYKNSITAGQKIEFFWWDDGKTGEIHPRYLVTEKGGMCFDRGFVEPNPIEQREAETPVYMLISAVTTSILLEYGEFSSKYKLVDKHSVQGEG